MANKARTKELLERSQRCVCKYCGGSLEVRTIVFNEILDARTELFCTHCDRVEYGVEKELYQSAKYFVDTFEYNCFPDLDETALTRQMSVAKVCEIMNWAVKNLGFLDQHGFCVPLNIQTGLVGECLHLNDAELEKITQAAGDQFEQLGY